MAALGLLLVPLLLPPLLLLLPLPLLQPLLPPLSPTTRPTGGGQHGPLLCTFLLRVVRKGAAFPRPAAWAGSHATIGSGQHLGDALEVDLEVAHPQTKEVNVEMTDDQEAEIEGERDLVAGIKEDLGQETGSV